MSRLLQEANLPNYEWDLFLLKALLVVTAFALLVALPARALNLGASKHKKKLVVRCIRAFVAFSLGLVGFAAAAVLMIVFLNPYNTFTARRVFQTPLLTADECQHIIDMSFAAAERNQVIMDILWERNEHEELEEREELLDEEPFGWQKLRHSAYPTTDLNLVQDPFLDTDRAWLQGIFHQRLSPVLSRIYGIPAAALEDHDVFIVRYDADEERSALKKHTDGGYISFTITLNTGFEGGGTQFWDRTTDEPFGKLDSSERPGQLSTFHASTRHEGLPTTKGQRLILVGFCNVERYWYDDKDVASPTGISLFATWFNFDWALIRLPDIVKKDGWWFTNRKLRRKAKQLFAEAEPWHDRRSVHSIEPSLVSQEQLPQLIKELALETANVAESTKASWLLHDEDGYWFDRFDDEANGKES